MNHTPHTAGYKSKKTYCTIYLLLVIAFPFLINAQTSVIKKNLENSTAITNVINVVDTEGLNKNTSFDNQKSTLENKGRRIEYYQNGQNGMELIVKKGDTILVVSTYDSKPLLKEAVAQLIYQMFARKEIVNDSVLTFGVPSAIVTGLYKVKVSDKFINLSFYFQKIYWENGLTEIHQGKEFIATPSSAPFSQPSFYRKNKLLKKK